MKLDTPHVDWLALSPELSLLAAAGVCLLAAVLLPGWARRGTAAFVALAGFVTAGVFAGVFQQYWVYAAVGAAAIVLAAMYML
ncbi:MAG: hypothetical protein ACJ74P_12095, partial [Gaiellaceae bacterium]